PYRNYLYTKEQRLISVFKSIDTLKEHSRNTRGIIWLTKSKLGKELQKVFRILSTGHWLEKRKKGVSLDDLFDLLFCISRY
ncbi:MAG TPA: hypothetical protein VIK29_08535, partial [Paludibacter sp.]